MPLNAFAVMRTSWIALGILWTVGLLFTKPVIRRQALGARAFHLALAALGFCLLGGHWFQVGWMGASFLPGLGAVKQAVQGTGIVMTVVGCLFAGSARIALGGNWSGAATVKAHHELVTRGPYAFARHPIYAGLLTAVSGTALIVGQWRSVVGTIVIFLALAVKIAQEERLMMQEFPSAYLRYRERVRALIPGIL